MGLFIQDGVANNMLCYISTARNSMPRDKIALNCIAYYPEEEVKAAKQVLYTICGVTPNKRVGPNKLVSNVDDILNLYDKTESDGDLTIPKFFAEDHKAFPPRDFENIAPIIAHISDEISLIKIELSEVKEAKTRDIKALDDFGCVKQDISDIKTVLNTKFPREANVNGTINPDNSATPLITERPTPPLSEITSDRENMQHEKSYASATVLPSSAKKPVHNASCQNAPSNSTTSAINSLNTEPHSQGARKRDTQEHRKKGDQRSFKVVGVGQHKGRGLHPAKQRDLDIFVGGLDRETTSDDIESHCNDNNIVFKKIEKLTTKSLHQQPFKITVAATDREKYLIPEIWPKGVFVRKYFNPRSSKTIIAA